MILLTNPDRCRALYGNERNYLDHTIPAYSDEFNPQPFCVRDADTRIRIESNLPGLLSGLADPDIRVSCVVQETHRLHDRWNGQTHEESYFHREAKPESSRVYTHGLEIFVKTPSDTRRAVERSDESKSVHAVWRVRAQLAVKNGGSTWVFPAPKPRDATPFSSAHATPNFKEVDQLFWADESTHRAWSGK